MKFRIFVIFVASLIAILAGFGASVALAQDVPAPYTGQKNPFPWDDGAAKDAGKSIYTRSCQGCHGADGRSIPTANFGTDTAAKNIESKPDYYFWLLSEGRMSNGMPGFKSSLSEDQRWQTVTYMHALGGQAASSGDTSAPKPPAGALVLTAPQKAKVEEALTLEARVFTLIGQPIPNADVKFYFKADFFTVGLVEIGEATTDDQGNASIEYTPQVSGSTDFVAKYGDAESEAAVEITGIAQTYQTSAGLEFPSFTKNIVMSMSNVRLELTNAGTGGNYVLHNNAPGKIFRLPGGIFSWLLIFAGIIGFIWFTYFRVIFQIFIISANGETRVANPRIVPIIGLALVTAVGLGLVFIILTGPYSHLNLPY